MSSASSTSSESCVLRLDHLRAFAAWLAHGPGTMRQVAGRADMNLIELHPRSMEILAVGGLQVVGHTSGGPTCGERAEPIYIAHLTDVATPSNADIVERRLNTMPERDQVSIAAGIMAKFGKRGKRTSRNQQPEIELKGDASECAAPHIEPVRGFQLE